MVLQWDAFASAYTPMDGFVPSVEAYLYQQIYFRRCISVVDFMFSCSDGTYKFHSWLDKYNKG